MPSSLVSLVLIGAALERSNGQWDGAAFALVTAATALLAGVSGTSPRPSAPRGPLPLLFVLLLFLVPFSIRPPGIYLTPGHDPVLLQATAAASAVAAVCVVLRLVPPGVLLVVSTLSFIAAAADLLAASPAPVIDVWSI